MQPHTCTRARKTILAFSHVCVYTQTPVHTRASAYVRMCARAYARAQTCANQPEILSQAGNTLMPEHMHATARKLGRHRGCKTPMYGARVKWSIHPFTDANLDTKIHEPPATISNHDYQPATTSRHQAPPDTSHHRPPATTATASHHQPPPATTSHHQPPPTTSTDHHQPASQPASHQPPPPASHPPTRMAARQQGSHLDQQCVPQTMSPYSWEIWIGG